MDYEKLHKDTINRLQQMVSCGKITVETACDICADFVPERDDERIRRSLSTYFAKFNPNDMWDDDFSFGDIVAWFEKQGGQKPTEWSEEDEKMCTKTIFALAGFMGNEDKIDWLKSLKDRYTWKPTGEQMGIIAQSVAVLKVSGHDELGDRLGDISEQLNKLKG